MGRATPPGSVRLAVDVATPTGPPTTTQPLPPGWREYADVDGVTRYPPIPPEYLNFAKRAGWVITPNDVFVFSHRMRTPAGADRLVVVFTDSSSPTGARAAAGVMCPVVFQPTSLVHAAPFPISQFQPIQSGDPRPIARYARSFRLYEGAVDPVDPTRMIVPYEIDGHGGRIEGRLDDRNWLTFHVVDGPAFRPDE